MGRIMGEITCSDNSWPEPRIVIALRTTRLMCRVADGSVECRAAPGKSVVDLMKQGFQADCDPPSHDDPSLRNLVRRADMGFGRVRKSVWHPLYARPREAVQPSRPVNCRFPRPSVGPDSAGGAATASIRQFLFPGCQSTPEAVMTATATATVLDVWCLHAATGTDAGVNQARQVGRGGLRLPPDLRGERNPGRWPVADRHRDGPGVDGRRTVTNASPAAGPGTAPLTGTSGAVRSRTVTTSACLPCPAREQRAVGYAPRPPRPVLPVRADQGGTGHDRTSGHGP
ncbi:hypothetical protein GCM10018781_04120 [Kitasatospora indigofera]|uniref:Uncharacterized protein n=1 Tax=Kitasatospora indigofera TaxID=67307 RepID=A0A919FBG6_9ACTN|nr:hypothetical protein GCM10018781_04120 [Kitasatospora indigofera]